MPPRKAREEKPVVVEDPEVVAKRERQIAKIREQIDALESDSRHHISTMERISRKCYEFMKFRSENTDWDADHQSGCNVVYVKFLQGNRAIPQRTFEVRVLGSDMTLEHLKLAIQNKAISFGLPGGTYAPENQRLWAYGKELQSEPAAVCALSEHASPEVAETSTQLDPVTLGELHVHAGSTVYLSVAVHRDSTNVAPSQTQDMLTKLEVRSNRVKGLSFHPTKTWILCGLHNGIVQILDFRLNTTVDRYEKHEGPVRGVDFHPTQPLFASGGDDQCIRVWNYKLHRCLFMLTGHMDYIRTVQFHLSQPWILSSSDDTTLRIWNWQSRCCIANLPGHSHFVMSAQFHPDPTIELVVSASLDNSIRVWNVSDLRRKQQRSGFAQDILGSSEVSLQCQIEGHEKGVNWAAFHPTQRYIVSASDDHTIRLWTYDANSSFYSEERQLRSHTANISCVTFFKEYIISNSEDRTMRVWDMNGYNPLMTFRRDHERFWTLAINPSRNLIAGGHDSGLLVFKLFRERPTWCIRNDDLFYVSENIKVLCTYNFTKSDALIQNNGEYRSCKSMSCNPSDSLMVLWLNGKGGEYRIVSTGDGKGVKEVARSFAKSAVFFTSNKLAVLDMSGQLLVRTIGTEGEKQLEMKFSCQQIFPGPPGFIVCKSADKLYMYQIAQQCAIAEYAIEGVKYITWDKDCTRFIAQTKKSFVVLTRRMQHIATVAEPSSRIKSVVFDEERDVLYYTTSDHLKVCSLRSTEQIIIRTTDAPYYLVRAKGNNYWMIDRQGSVTSELINNSELLMKLALEQQDFREVMRLIKACNIRSKAVGGYLCARGYPDIALQFFTDPIARFHLAVECGSMDIAKAMALEINKASIWQRLAEVAPRYGDMQLSQLANTKTQNRHALALQYVVTGNMNSLSQMVHTCNKDTSFQLQYSLYTNDVVKRIEILDTAKQLPLAYQLARSHKMVDVAEALLAKMSEDVAARCQRVAVSQPLSVPAVEGSQENWPMLPVKASIFQNLLQDPNMLEEVTEVEPVAAGGWGEDDDDIFGGGAMETAGAGMDADAGNGVARGEWDDDLEIDDKLLSSLRKQAGPVGAFTIPSPGDPAAAHWCSTPDMASYHVAGGAFESALKILRRQIGLVNPEPLKPFMLRHWIATHAATPSAMAPSGVMEMARPAIGVQHMRHVPALPRYVPLLQERVKQGQTMVTDGRFAEAHRIFLGIIHQLLLAEVENREQHTEMLELLSTAREYVEALNVELLRKEEPSAARKVELALYFTHFKLVLSHQVLALFQAMTQAYKLQNMVTAAAVARHILDHPLAGKQRADKARAVIQLAEQTPTDAERLEYDERNPFVLCCVSKKPMYRGTVDPIRCSYCFAKAHPTYAGKTCPVCLIAELGAQTSGLICGGFQLQ